MQPHPRPEKRLWGAKSRDRLDWAGGAGKRECFIMGHQITHARGRCGACDTPPPRRGLPGAARNPSASASDILLYMAYRVVKERAGRARPGSRPGRMSDQGIGVGVEAQTPSRLLGP